jgi:hypothetical protein
MDERKGGPNGLGCLISALLRWQWHAHGLARTVRGEAMPGLKPVAGLGVILAGACAITWISAARPAIAQSLSEVCRPSGGGETCRVYPAPVGSPCGCFTPSGRVAGRVEPPPTTSKGGTQEKEAITCQTRYGRCRIYPSSVGDECKCGDDPGTVVTDQGRVKKQ